MRAQHAPHRSFTDGRSLEVLCRTEYVKEAVQEDQNNNYERAFELYKIALEYFSTHLKYEKNPRSKQAIQEKVGRRSPASSEAVMMQHDFEDPLRHYAPSLRSLTERFAVSWHSL